MASDAAGEGEKSSVEYSFMQAGGAGCPWRLAPPPPPPLQRPPPPRCRPPRPPAGLPGYAARGLRARPLHLSLRPQGARPGTRRGATACRRRPSVPRRLHAQLAKSGHGADVYVTSTLVHAYAAAAADAASARAVFDAARNRNVVTWTAMIAGHAAAGEARDAVALFREAVASGQEVINSVTVAQVMTACAQCGDMDSGRWVHDTLRRWRVEPVLLDVALATAVLCMSVCMPDVVVSVLQLKCSMQFLKGTRCPGKLWLRSAIVMEGRIRKCAERAPDISLCQRKGFDGMDKHDHQFGEACSLPPRMQSNKSKEATLQQSVLQQGVPFCGFMMG
ncbi:hypothetical protein ZWY2020_048634 [Hordeum vulgare]|nr:hypothetical protein ZWY2020_048634 [Hordeum vulgare]